MIKTETEKAIEYLKEGIKDGESLRELKSLDEREKNELTKSINKINMVITLLQQGEKYKTMWNMNMKEAFQNSKESETIHPTRILLDLERLEQQHFPKEVRNA